MQEPKEIIKQLLEFYQDILDKIDPTMIVNSNRFYLAEDFKEIIILKGNVYICTPRVGFTLNIPKIGKFISSKRKKLEEDLNKVLQKLQQDQANFLFPLRWRDNDYSRICYKKNVSIEHAFNYRIEEKELPSGMVKIKRNLIQKWQINSSLVALIEKKINDLRCLKEKHQITAFNMERIAVIGNQLNSAAGDLYVTLDEEIKAYKKELFAFLGFSEEEIKSISYCSSWNPD